VANIIYISKKEYTLVEHAMQLFLNPIPNLTHTVDGLPLTRLLKVPYPTIEIYLMEWFVRKFFVQIAEDI
jgi:hypothetical protein